jgi:hypothetical protein
MNLIKKIHCYIVFIKLYKIDKLSKKDSKWIASQIINHIYKIRK